MVQPSGFGLAGTQEMATRIFRWILPLLLCLSAGPALAWQGSASLRLGPSALTPGASVGLAGGLRGAVTWNSGFEIAGAFERAQYTKDLKYLGTRGEVIYHFSRASFGLVFERGQFLLGNLNGRDFWSTGAVGRYEFQILAPGFKWGADLLALVKKPGEKVLTTLSPGVWIQALF